MVDIVKKGRAWVIVPSAQSWTEWFENTEVSSDFMDERKQPKQQERQPL